MIDTIIATPTSHLPLRGALTDTELLLVETVQGKRVLRSSLLPRGGNDLGETLEHLWQTGLTEVWVMPSTALSQAATCAWFEQIRSQQWIVVVHPASHESSRPVCTLVWPKGGRQQETGRHLALVFPEFAGWGWTLPDARSLLATISYLDEVLRVPLLDGPEMTAHQLLASRADGHLPMWQGSARTDLPRLHNSDGAPVPMMEAAVEIAWMRPFTLTEQRQRYLHKYTHLSRHLEACLSVQLGGGAPEYSPNGRAYDGIHPGLWRVHIERGGSLFDGKRLPGMLNEEWMSTPQVRCCQDISYQVEVYEGCFWPRSADLLKAWATTLWQAGERLHVRPQRYRHSQGRANALRALMLLARLGLAVVKQEENEGGWARPDWWMQIAGRSQALLFTGLARMARKGIMPVLTNGDSFWIVSDEPNPLTAAPDLVAGPRWKGYSVAYETPLALSYRVKDIFRTAENPSQAASALDALAGASNL